MFASCYTFAFICCVYDFMFELKSERKNDEFQLFLYLSQRIPTRSAVEVSARSALTEGSDRDKFCSHSSQKCSWAQESCKECAGQVNFRVANLSEGLRTAAVGVHRVEEL
jgi:hypothetical protein